MRYKFTGYGIQNDYTLIGNNYYYLCWLKLHAKALINKVIYLIHYVNIQRNISAASYIVFCAKFYNILQSSEYVLYTTKIKDKTNFHRKPTQCASYTYKHLKQQQKLAIMVPFDTMQYYKLQHITNSYKVSWYPLLRQKNTFKSLLLILFTDQMKYFAVQNN